MEFQEHLATRIKVVNEFLAGYMERDGIAESETLREAMKHALFSGGKRFRPILAIASAEVFSVPMERVMPTACALELIHTYSLIHDDLPSLDDDDFRRGKPTAHRVFGEGMAVLAGDALLTAAFGLIAENGRVPGVTERQVLDVVADVARACGAAGMVGGQAIDIASTGTELDQNGIEMMDRLKTGALIAVSARVGAILGGASKSDIESITDYGQCLGIAFQIGDDVLDAVGDESKMGKRVRKDAEKQKNSMVRVLGVDGARERARYYIGEAKRAVNKFGERANAVVKLADLVLNRES